MKRYLLGLIGLAVLGGSPLWADPCGNAAVCGVEAGCNCCPRCGCKLVPACQATCDTKKETTHEYCCARKEICIPRVTPICQGGRGCDDSGGCVAGCDTGSSNNRCEDSCAGRCRVREVHKLMIHPVTKEVPVRKYSVAWTCPNCGNCGSCESTAAPAAVPVAPSPASPAPSPKRLPPPPKTTQAAPVPSEVGALRLP